MPPGPQHIPEAQIQQRQVAVHHQDIGKIAEVPQSTQIHACNVGDDAKGYHHQAEHPHPIDKGRLCRNAVGAHLTEGHKAQQTGKGKQAKADADQGGDQVVQHTAAAGQRPAGSQELFQLAQLEPRLGLLSPCHPYPAHDDHKTGQRADNDGIQKNTQRLYTALLTGVLHLSGSRRHRDRALACLVGHQAPLDALAERHAECAAKHRLRLECLAEHRPKEPGDPGEIAQDQRHHRGHIDHSHDRHHPVGDLGDLFDAAKADQRRGKEQHAESDPVQCRIGGDGLACDRRGNSAHRRDGIEALCREAQQRIDDVQQTQRYAYPSRIAQQLAAIKRHTAHIAILPLFLKDLAEGRLYKRGSHAKESRDPHPEQCSRPADGDRTGNAQDVARPYPHSSGQQKGRQRGNAVFGAAAPQQCPQPIPKTPHLHKPQFEGKKHARTHQQDDGQAEIAQHRDRRIPVQIAGKAPEPIRHQLDLGADHIDHVKQRLHTHSSLYGSQGRRFRTAGCTLCSRIPCLFYRISPYLASGTPNFCTETTNPRPAALPDGGNDLYFRLSR